MKAVKVPLKQLNDIRIDLMEKEIMRKDYKIKTIDGFGYIPIYEGHDLDLEIVDVQLDELKVYPKDFTDLLDSKLSNEESKKLRTSFDTIGDVVILEIPEELENKKIEIGEAALTFTKRKSVYMKKSAVHGETRIRDLELLAGEDEPVTIHKEHGTRLKLNVKEVYFSPRLATERKRVADSVKDGEKILDMFCGIGPFPFVIAKDKKVDITACDINESAIYYLNENIKLNKSKGTVKGICSDVRKVNLEDKFDRIIMNLPGLAYQFLDLAFKYISDNGIINYYEFSDDYTQGIERLEQMALKENKKIEILNTRKVKSTSPGMWHVAIDCKVLKK